MYVEKKTHQNGKYKKVSQYWLTIYMAVLMHESKILASANTPAPSLSTCYFPCLPSHLVTGMFLPFSTGYLLMPSIFPL